MGRKPKTIESINDWLAMDGIAVRLLQRGQSLYCQATVPIDGGWKQRQIPLGIKYSDAGLDDAKLAAIEIHRQIKTGTFQLSRWAKPKKKADAAEGESIGDLVARFEKHYRATNTLSDQSWRDHWAYVLDALPKDEPLQVDMLIRLVMDARQHPRKQKEYSQKLQRLANFAGVTVNLKQYAGQYRPEPRTVPTDAEVVECRDRLSFNPKWQWVYGVMATFGCRPHETFFCEFTDPLTLKIIEGKTGPRTTKAIYPQWAKDWDLIAVDRPETGILTHKHCGQKVASFFYQNSRPDRLTMKPYDLRHAWCIRGTVKMKIALPVMAAWAGHTPDVHLRTYNKWISAAHAEAAYDAINWRSPDADPNSNP